MLGQIPTFRRIWVALIFIGGGLIPIAAFLPLYFDAVFGVDVFGRGVLAALGSGAGLLGLILAGRFTDRWIARDPGRVQFTSGMMFFVLGGGLVLLALAPNLGVAVAASMLIGLVAGLFQPMSSAVQALVCPPRARGVGFAFGSIFLAAGVFIAPIGGAIADGHGLRWAILAFAPVITIGGLVLASAARFVAADAARARATLEMSAQLAGARQTLGGNALLVCRGVDVAYDSVQVLFGVDIEITEGSIVALLGTNGAGKSTLLRAIVGLTPPSRGMIFFDGRDVLGMNAWEAARLGIVLMPGGKAVFPTLSVEENLRLAGWLHRGTPAELRALMNEAIDHFPQLVARRHEAAGNLSGGEQQMLALAQTLISKPRLLMIDELTLGLAPTVVQTLLGVLPRIAATGATIVLVEQSVNLALSIADQAYFMEKGQVRFHGRTADLLERRDLLRSVFLEGAAKSMPGADVGGASATDMAQAAELIGGSTATRG
jgi:branched-chain amino acid transport system ATP-binding protein